MMAHYDSIVQSALSSCKYKHVDSTKNDVRSVLYQYRGLSPTAETFVFNNGSQKNLLALSGTIPVMYKGGLYHIPVKIWLLDTHPMNAPMAFVQPTPDMRIKVSRHVDHNGKVYLPYLHDWKHTSSDLLGLVQVLICTFQEQPPVYSVVRSPPPPPVQMPQPQQPVPYPTYNSASTPYPTGGPVSMPMPGVGAGPMNSQGSPQFSMRPSLLTAAEEKIRRRLEDMYLASEIAHKTNEQLKEGTNKLERMMMRLNDEKETLQRNVDVCKKEIAQLDAKIAKGKNEEDEAPIDTAIYAPTPLYKQIVNVFSEEAAIEDTIYHLGDALRREALDLDQYLKYVRMLSRKQFMLRATLNKCRQKAGLAG